MNTLCSTEYMYHMQLPIWATLSPWVTESSVF